MNNPKSGGTGLQLHAGWFSPCFYYYGLQVLAALMVAAGAGAQGTGFATTSGAAPIGINGTTGGAQGSTTAGSLQSLAGAGAVPDSATQQSGASGPIPAIINGQKTMNPGWVAHLHLDGTSCGGTLIGNRWLATAAHCFAPDWDMSTNPPTFNSEVCGPTNQNPITGECSVASGVILNNKWFALIGGEDRWVVTPTTEKRLFRRVFVDPRFYTVNTANTPGCSRNVPLTPNTPDVMVCVENPYDVALIELNAPSTKPTLGYSCDPSTPCVGGPNVASYGWGLCYPGSTAPGSNCEGGPNNNPQLTLPFYLQTTAPSGIPVVQCPAGNPPADYCLHGNTPKGPAATFSGDSGGPNVILNAQPGNVPLLVGITSWAHSEFNLNNLLSGHLRTGAVCDYIQSTSGIKPSTLTVPACAVPPTRRCGTLNIGSRFDTSACANIRMWGKCQVKCAGGGTAVSTYTCTNMLVYIGVPPSCPNPPIRPPTSGCNTPWGFIAANSSKRVPYNPKYCALTSGGKRCGGMWVACGANGAWSVRCIY